MRGYDGGGICDGEWIIVIVKRKKEIYLVLWIFSGGV